MSGMSVAKMKFYKKYQVYQLYSKRLRQGYKSDSFSPYNAPYQNHLA